MDLAVEGELGCEERVERLGKHRFPRPKVLNCIFVKIVFLDK